MGNSIDTELNALFSQMEREQRCLVPRSEQMRQNLRKRLHPKRGNPGLVVLSPARGMYARPEYWQALNAVERSIHVAGTLAHMHPSWTFCRFTAAAIRGWSVALPLATPLHVASPWHHNVKDMAFHVLRPGPDGAIPHDTVNGIRITTELQTLCDCLRSTAFTMALPIADSALRCMGATSLQVAERMRRDPMLRGTRGIRRALEVLSHANGLSESGGESFARAVMIELGFATPELQVEYPDPIDAGAVFRVDFRWVLPDGSVVIGEFDGKEKYRNPAMTRGRDAVAVLTDERLRESHLSATGARIMRFSYADVLNRAKFEHLLTSYGVPRQVEL